jgi:hypothetical protein
LCPELPESPEAAPRGCLAAAASELPDSLVAALAGCAGTGKSLLLRALLRVLPPASTFVTGTTGLAGAALGGVTINSFAGVGRAEGSPAELAARAARGAAAVRWRQAEVLIIDEVRCPPPPAPLAAGRRVWGARSMPAALSMHTTPTKLQHAHTVLRYTHIP